MKEVYVTTIRVLLLLVLVLITVILVAISRRSVEDNVIEKGESVVIIDQLGRSVVLPETVDSIICLKASAIRLVSYCGGADKICGVEECEVRGNPYTHIYANPYLKEKRVIGPMMGGDVELIALAKPNLIFTTCSTVGEADLLQRKTGIPVVALEYGDLGRNRGEFYKALTIIGQCLDKESRVDSLINFIERELNELDSRSIELTDSDSIPSLYVCGISYKGRKGITSTDPFYPALNFLNVKSVAEAVDSSLISAVNGTIVDMEEIIKWSPQILFVDADGYDLVVEDLKRLKADSVELHLIWPYNNIHSNFEVMLANSWYMGKVLHPEGFEDVDIKERQNRIMRAFLNADIADSLRDNWGETRKILRNE